MLKESSIRNLPSKSSVFSEGLTKEFLGTHSSVVECGLVCPSLILDPSRPSEWDVYHVRSINYLKIQQ